MRNYSTLKVILHLNFVLSKVTDILGGKCQDLFTEIGEGVGQGQLLFQVPKSITKWKIEIEFDSPITSIQPYEGTNEQCDPASMKCFYENEDWNGEKEEGEEFSQEFEGIFDEASALPKITKVMFRGSDSEHSWSTVAIVCGENGKLED